MSTLDRFKRLHVVVGIPSLGGQWKEQFGMCLLAMFNHFHTQKIGDFRDQQLWPASVRGSSLPNLRLDLSKYAIARKSTHLAFIDTDQKFPKDLLHRLIKHDVDVVACNIATKEIPAQPTARYFNPTDLLHGTRVYNTPSKGLEKVWRVGTGVMLIKTSVFAKTGLNVWEMPWQESAQKYQGEDWSFVAACEKHSIPVYIDHAVSEQVKHVGDFDYDHDVVGTMEGAMSKAIEEMEKIANG